MKALRILSVILLTMAPHWAQAWGDDGHKTMCSSPNYLDSVVKTKITAMLDADADNLTSDDLAAKRPGRTNIATATIAATTTSRLKTGTSSTWKSTTPTWPVRVSGTLPCHLARWR